MTPLVAMVRANLKMSLRNRAALFWNLAFPALFIVIFGVVFGRGTTVEFGVGVAGAESAFRDAVIAALRDNPSFAVSLGDEAEELGALEDGNRGVVAVFASPADASAGDLPAVTLYYNATEGPVSRVAVGAVRQTVIDVAGGPPPLSIEERPVTAQDVSFMDVFAPGILAMSLMNSGVIGLATAFVTYRERGILRRIRVTPFPLTSFILARVISQLLVAGLQAVILIGMAWAFFGLHLRGNPLVLLLAIAAGALAFLAIGFAISG
ncbi:MAG: type transporter, partial [Thermomicrobiales bacterium]|nr:type transporter [Thermomicrobiales bacterium]